MDLAGLVVVLMSCSLASGYCPVHCKSGLNCTDPDAGCPECAPAYWGRHCENRVECVFDDDGASYRGTKNTTSAGIGCQAWSSQSPHQHIHSSGEENYCRNMDNGNSPWCYTLLPEVRWDYCGVPQCGYCPVHCKSGLNCTDPDAGCPECAPAYWGRHCENRVECVFDDDGASYRGTKNTTSAGIGCQAWSSQSPHQHIHSSGEENYCRNMGNGNSPWCYTLLPEVRWDYCGVPQCEKATPTETQTYVTSEPSAKSTDVTSPGNPTSVTSQTQGNPDSVTSQTPGNATSVTSQTPGNPDSVTSQTSGNPDSVTSQTPGNPTSVRIDLGDGISTPKPICDICRCQAARSNVTQTNRSMEEILEIMKETMQALTVNKTTLSSFVRKKTSARDDRASASTMGYIGAIVIASVGLLFIMSDLLSLERHASQLRNRRRKVDKKP